MATSEQNKWLPDAKNSPALAGLYTTLTNQPQSKGKRMIINASDVPKININTQRHSLATARF